MRDADADASGDRGGSGGGAYQIQLPAGREVLRAEDSVDVSGESGARSGGGERADAAVLGGDGPAGGAAGRCRAFDGRADGGGGGDGGARLGAARYGAGNPGLRNSGALAGAVSVGH